MQRLHAALAASVLSCLLAATANAASPLHYDEAIDGDLSPTSLVTELGLDIGHNTVKGQMHVIAPLGGSNAPFDIDFDAMNLLLPAGQRITAMSVAFSFIDTTQNTQRVDWSWAVRTWPSDVVNETCFVIIGPGMGCPAPVASPTGGDLLGNLPTTAQRYLVTHGNGMLWNDFQKPVGGSLDYTLSIDVTAVPEPANWLLALGGLTLLGWLTRSRRAHRA